MYILTSNVYLLNVFMQYGVSSYTLSIHPYNPLTIEHPPSIYASHTSYANWEAALPLVGLFPLQTNRLILAVR